jgi:hypothetical protein
MTKGYGKGKCQLLEAAVDTEAEYQCLMKTKIVEELTFQEGRNFTLLTNKTE